MKLSVSLSEDDVAFVDRYAREHGAGSRSAVLQRALLLLKTSELGDDYAAAWDEWAPEAEAWDATIGDGLG
jgi:Arc/MetJ-type ribon-helix-helix transcriptional regulator